MSRYYFFAATLPSLVFGTPAPLSSREFLERAKRSLDPADCETIEAATLMAAPDGKARPQNSRVLKLHDAWDRELRNTLAALRAERLGRIGKLYLRPSPEGQSVPDSIVDRARAAAAAAFKAETPLEGEIAIEKGRWALLDGESPFQTFDIESLVAYRLELQILERLALFSPEAGEKEYRTAYAAILATAQSSSGTGV